MWKLYYYRVQDDFTCSGIKYTAESAGILRSHGLEISDSDIDDDSAGNIAGNIALYGAAVNVPIFNTDPVTGRDGTTRYRVSYSMVGMSSSEKRTVRSALIVRWRRFL